jgi:hypothetical protein
MESGELVNTKSRVVVAGILVSVMVTTVSFLMTQQVQASERFHISDKSREVDGCNIYRFEDFMVVYTRITGQTVTPTNEYGYEVAVVGGEVVAVSDGTGGMPIPLNGAVVSGHGEERLWLRDNVNIKDPAVLPDCSRLSTPFPSQLLESK